MKKRYVMFIGAGALCIGVLMWIYVRDGGEAPVYEAAPVVRDTITHTVSVTGHVEPVQRIALSFPMGGRVATLVEEGTDVARGEMVATLERGELLAAMREANTRVVREEALLAQVSAPLRNEERALKETALEKARDARLRAEESARATLAETFVTVDDAIREEADELFSGPAGPNPKFGIRFTYGSTDYLLQADSMTESVVNTERSRITDILVELKARAASVDAPMGNLTATEHDLVFIESFLNRVANAINRYLSTDTSAQTVYEGFQTSIAAARSAVSSARGKVVSARKEVDAAYGAERLAERDLALAKAGATSEARAVQEATVRVAREAAGGIAERLSNAVLTAPIAGTVSQVLPDVGEGVGPYQTVAELLTEGAYEVEAYIPEADIARVKLGDLATVTFDAFERSDVYTAEVIRIALSENIREGVPTYKTTLVLTRPPAEGVTLRPGMTADIDITTDKRDDVLFVQARSVITKGDRTYVRVVGADGFEERDVVTGLRSSEGTVEILNGLTEGEQVVLYVEE